MEEQKSRRRILPSAGLATSINFPNPVHDSNHLTHQNGAADTHVS
jgi:hypothetical protein